MSLVAHVGYFGFGVKPRPPPKPSTAEGRFVLKVSNFFEKIHEMSHNAKLAFKKVSSSLDATREAAGGIAEPTPGTSGRT